MIACLLGTSFVEAAEDPLVPFLDVRLTGGLAIAATCVNHADPAEGGPTGGVLRLDGVPPGARIAHAYLYWTVLGTTVPVNPGSPTLDDVPLDVVRLGEVRRTPCFNDGQLATASFRADVTGLVIGNGEYRLGGFLGSGSTEGDLTEGATLFAVWCDENGPATQVVIWDGVDATNPQRSEPLFSQTISGLAVDPDAPVRATLALAAGNGQGANDPSRPMPPDPAFFEGEPIEDRVTDFLDGALCPGAPPNLLGLYDRTVVDVSDLVAPGQESVTFSVEVMGDCHSFAAAALAVATLPQPAEGEPSALDLRPTAPPLTVRKLDASRLRVEWEGLTVPTHLYAGSLGSWYSHAPIAACALDESAFDVTPQRGGRYYLSTGLDCTNEDGSLGRDSLGAERPSALDASGMTCVP